MLLFAVEHWIRIRENRANECEIYQTLEISNYLHCVNMENNIIARRSQKSGIETFSRLVLDVMWCGGCDGGSTIAISVTSDHVRVSHNISLHEYGRACFSSSSSSLVSSDLVCACVLVYSSSCYKVTIRKALMLPFEKSTERPKVVDASHIHLDIANVWYERMCVEREICRSLDAVVTLLFYLLHSNLLCLKPCCTDGSLPFHEIHHTFRIGRVCCKQRSLLDHSFLLLGPSQNWMKFRIWASHIITENLGWEFGGPNIFGFFWAETFRSEISCDLETGRMVRP